MTLSFEKIKENVIPHDLAPFISRCLQNRVEPRHVLANG